MRYQMNKEDRNFNRKVHEAAMQYGKYATSPIEGMEFTLNVIGKGAFSEVLKGYDSDGKPVALKVFKPILQSDVRDYFRNAVRKRKRIFRQDPFAKLRFVFPDNPFCAHVTDYIEGSTVRDCLSTRLFLRRSERFVDLEDRDTQARIVSTYVSMLKLLHPKGLLYYDNSWKNVIVNSKEVRVIDPDSVRSFGELNSKQSDLKLDPFTATSASIAQVRGEGYSSSVDLEGFALMVDRFYNRSYFFYGDRKRMGSFAVCIKVREPKREYPLERVEKIPPRLREFVVQVISKPLEHGMTLSDLESAVNHEFSL